MTTAVSDRPSLRLLLAGREFRAYWAGNAALVAAGTAQSLALSVFVFDRTGSALLAAVALLAGVVPQLIAGVLLLSLADRIPARRLLAVWSLVRALVALTLAYQGLPVWLALTLVITTGLGGAVEMAARSALLVDVVPDGAYALGRSVINVTVGLMQVAGYAMGGTLVVAAGPTAGFLAAAGLAVVSSLTCIGLAHRPARAARRERSATTWRGTRSLLGDPSIRGTLLGHWLPNGLIVGAEALYVPYAGSGAAALFVSAALGMACGDLIVGRFMDARTRARLVAPLYVLLALPYLAFAARPTGWIAVCLVGLASIGFGGTLGLNERLVDLLPSQLRGQGMGLAGSGTQGTQAIAAAAAGSLAELTHPSIAMTVMASGSLIATATLWRTLTATGATNPRHCRSLNPPVPTGSAGP